MGKKAKYPAPELSEEAIQPLKGDRQRLKTPDSDLFTIVSLIFSALALYTQETTFGLLSCLLLISSWINQKPDTPFLSNSFYSFLICVVMVFATYWRKIEGI